MSDMKKSWEEAGSKLSALGLKLKYHFDEEHSEEVAETEEMRGAVEKLRAAFDSAFEAMGDAAKDPAVKDDVRESARLLRDALADTFSEAGDVLRGAFTQLDSAAETPALDQPAEEAAPEEAPEEAPEG